jgi:DNA replication protein DnaD
VSFANKAPHFDLSELHIERLFITDFMPVASGTYVKVYLMGSMYANASQRTYHADNRTLATALQLPLQDVIDAWHYWEKQGIVKCHPHEDDSDFDVEFFSLRALYIENNFVPKQKKRSNTASAPYSQTTAFKTQQAAFASLIRDVEQIVGHPLSPNEHRELSDFYEHYYPDASILKRAFSYNYKERKSFGFKRIKILLEQWLKAGLTSLESIEAHIEHTGARYAIYKEILAVLGVRHRLPYQTESDAIDRWLDSYAFEPADLIEIIKSLSKRTTNVNFNYLEAQITDLNGKGIKTVSELPTAAKQASSPKRRHQYTVEKDRTYTEDELESMLLNKK